MRDRGLLETVLLSAKIGLQAYLHRGELSWPAERRLAFRELGLSIGLAAAEELARWWEEQPELFVQRGTQRDAGIHPDALLGSLSLREEIEAFWQDEANQQAHTWTDHREINMVMLAASLSPGQFLLI